MSHLAESDDNVRKDPACGGAQLFATSMPAPDHPVGCRNAVGFFDGIPLAMHLASDWACLLDQAAQSFVEPQA